MNIHRIIYCDLFVDDAEGNSVSQPRGLGAGGNVQTHFSRLDFLYFSGEDPTGGYIRLNNSFDINAQLQTRELYWHHSTYKMMLCNDIGGLRKLGQTSHGKNLHKPYVYVLVPQIMKILMRH